jgi:hypothetical protein
MILAAVNCLMLIGFYLMMILLDWNISKRLIDLNMSMKTDVIMLFSFFGVLIVGLLVNVVLLSLSANDVERQAAKASCRFYFFVQIQVRMTVTRKVCDLRHYSCRAIFSL